MPLKNRSKCNRQRRGAAVVELAMSLPVLIIFLLGSMEMGRAVMAKHVLEEAARAGCRVAVAEDSTTKDVEDVVDAAMGMAGISGHTVFVSPDPPNNLDAFEVVTVRVTIPYSDVAWFDAFYMKGKSLEGICLMPAETPGDFVPDPPGKKNKSKKGKKGKQGKQGKKNKK